jgi:excisionase family DNA binding protein
MTMIPAERAMFPPEYGFPTVQQLAAQLGVHENTVYEWIKRGDVRAVRLGVKRMVIDPASVLRPVRPESERHKDLTA